MGQMGCEMDDKAKKYRERAAKIRVTAEDVRGDDNPRLLLKVAKDYDHMALDLEADDRPERSIRKS